MKADIWEKLLKFDTDVTRRLRIAEKPGLLRSLAALLAHSGDSWFLLTGFVLLWWLGTGEWKRLAGICVISILLLAVVVFVIKFSVRRKRPEGEWGQIYRQTDPHSFPSGHAARAALLCILAITLGPSWFGLVFLIWAPLVILARVAMGVHYFSDVVAGAILGAVFGLIEVWILQ
jgi:membrane-associated phospholipid phosphatase